MKTEPPPLPTLNKINLMPGDVVTLDGSEIGESANLGPWSYNQTIGSQDWWFDQEGCSRNLPFKKRDKIKVKSHRRKAV